MDRSGFDSAMIGQRIAIVLLKEKSVRVRAASETLIAAAIHRQATYSQKFKETTTLYEKTL